MPAPVAKQTKVCRRPSVKTMLGGVFAPEKVGSCGRIPELCTTVGACQMPNRDGAWTTTACHDCGNNGAGAITALLSCSIDFVTTKGRTAVFARSRRECATITPVSVCHPRKDKRQQEDKRRYRDQQ